MDIAASGSRGGAKVEYTKRFTKFQPLLGDQGRERGWMWRLRARGSHDPSRLHGTARHWDGFIQRWMEHDGSDEQRGAESVALQRDGSTVPHRSRGWRAEDGTPCRTYRAITPRFH
ncbi:unnamed protein product [Lampetra fluviatilis]